MIQYVYCYYNRSGGFYTAPVINPYDTEKIVELTHQTFLANKGSSEHELQIKHDLYYLGTFDNVTGSFKLEMNPVFLTRFVEAEDNGRKEENS